MLPSIVSDESKAVVAKYTASELLRERDVVSLKIKEQLIKRARDFNIIITEVSMVCKKILNCVYDDCTIFLLYRQNLGLDQNLDKLLKPNKLVCFIPLSNFHFNSI